MKDGSAPAFPDKIPWFAAGLRTRGRPLAFKQQSSKQTGEHGNRNAATNDYVEPPRYRAELPGPLIMVTTLFFMWGFLTCLNDILIPHLKAIFDLNYAQVMLVQMAFFGAYAVFSIPRASSLSGSVQAHDGGRPADHGVGCAAVYPGC